FDHARDEGGDAAVTRRPRRTGGAAQPPQKGAIAEPLQDEEYGRAPSPSCEQEGHPLPWSGGSRRGRGHFSRRGDECGGGKGKVLRRPWQRRQDETKRRDQPQRI